MAEITIGRTLSSTTDSVSVEQGLSSVPWLSSSPLVPEDYDEIQLGYTGEDLTLVTYKKGGVTVVTLTLTYSAGRLVGVARA